MVHGILSDMRDLEPLPRIMSFVVLGLVLLAVTWTSTRYSADLSPCDPATSV